MKGLFFNRRSALPQLRRNLRFATIALATLAIGIGTSTDCFGGLMAAKPAMNVDPVVAVPL